MTCTESQHRDQVRWGPLTQDTCATYKASSLTQEPAGWPGSWSRCRHGRTVSQDEVGTSRRNDKNQKAAWKQPQKAFTSNALSHTMLGWGNTQMLSLKTKHCAELRLRTSRETKSQNPPRASCTSFTISLFFPAAMPVRPTALPRRRDATRV